MIERLALTEPPKGNSKGFLGFPVNLDLDNLNAQIAILGVPYGLPYYPNELSNDQSTAPDILRQNAQDAAHAGQEAGRRQTRKGKAEIQEEKDRARERASKSQDEFVSTTTYRPSKFHDLSMTEMEVVCDR